jgi:hypothetical protein
MLLAAIGAPVAVKCGAVNQSTKVRTSLYLKHLLSFERRAVITQWNLTKKGYLEYECSERSFENMLILIFPFLITGCISFAVLFNGFLAIGVFFKSRQ